MNLKQLNIQKLKLLDTKFFKKNKYFALAFNILENNIDNKNNNDLYCEKHHIFLRSISKYLNQKVDNSKNNLILLSYSDHIMVHCYLALSVDSQNYKEIFYKLIHPVEILLGKNFKNIQNTKIINPDDVKKILSIVQLVKNKEKLTQYQKDIDKYNWFKQQFKNNKTFQMLDKEYSKKELYHSSLWYELIDKLNLPNIYPFKWGTEQHSQQKSIALKKYYSKSPFTKDRLTKFAYAKFKIKIPESQEQYFIKEVDYNCLFGQIKNVASKYKVSDESVQALYLFLCKKYNLKPLAPLICGYHSSRLGVDDCEAAANMMMFIKNKISSSELKDYFKYADRSGVIYEWKRIISRHPNWDINYSISKITNTPTNFGTTDWEKFCNLYNNRTDIKLWNKLISVHPTWEKDVISGKLILNQPIIPQLIKRNTEIVLITK